MATYRLTIDAEEDLRGIADYTLEQFGLRQADLYISGLQACFAELAEMPRLGRDYSRVRAGVRRYEHESHSVYYRITDDGILILRILHQRMDPGRHLE